MARPLNHSSPKWLLPPQAGDKGTLEAQQGWDGGMLAVDLAGFAVTPKSVGRIVVAIKPNQSKRLMPLTINFR